MHVTLVARFAWPRIGGTETLIRELAGGAARAGDEVRVLAHRIDEDDVEWHGALDRAEPFAPRMDPLTGVATEQLRLRRREAIVLGALGTVGERRRSYEALHASVAGRGFARQLSGSEVVHRFGGNRMALATVRAAHHLDVPAVVTPLAHAGQWDADEISASAYREAELVIATSRADAEVYERLGVAGDRIAICALPTRRPTLGGGCALRERMNLDGPIVLFLGGRRPYKGISQLCDAAALLWEHDRDARVAFVGPGPALSQVSPNVLDVGAVDDAQRDAWLDAADLVCLPSAAESFGLVVSEAWSCGIPVVTSDIPVLRERVEESGGGIATVAEAAGLAEAIQTLLADPALRRRMGEAGFREWERSCSPDSVVAWHGRAYARAAGRGSGQDR